VEGLGTLTLGYNPQTGEWFSGDAYAAAWSNLGKLAVGLAVTTLPSTLMIQNMPGPAGRFLRDCQTTLLNAGKGLVAWDKWKDDPAAAAGEATFNIASIIIPASAATAPVRTSASTAAAAIRTTAKIIDVVDPASALIRVGTAGARIALPAIADLVRSVDLSKLDLGQLDAAGKIDIPEMPKIDATTVEVPAVAKSDMTLDTPNTASTADVPVRTVEEAATVPAREPALVGSGGDSVVRTGDAGHAGGSSGPANIGDTAPVGRSGDTAPVGGSGDTAPVGGSGGTHGTGADAGSDAPPAAGGSGTDGPTDGPASGSNDGYTSGDKEWNPSQGDDPVPSDADYGPGFRRTDDSKVEIDETYGQPKPDHGRLTDEKLPPMLEDLPRDVRNLVPEPYAPFGRDAAGNPYTREEFEARYIKADGEFRYPDNSGAVLGRRLHFTDVAEFQKHYGDVLDRFGGDGKYFSPDGTPFEERALPPSSLGDPYVRVRLTGQLPPNWKIEVSEVAPAFGRDGGGLQIRILDAEGTAMRMSVLRDLGIVRRIGDPGPADFLQPLAGTLANAPDWDSTHAGDDDEGNQSGTAE
jgi:hypothetical protein